MSKQTAFQPHFQGLRGAAAMIVVVSHYVGAFYPAAHTGDPTGAHMGWEVVFAKTPLALAVSGCFAVCVFFVLSGYVLTLPYMKEQLINKARIWASLFKRPIRLLGLILFTMILSYVLNRGGLYFNKYAAFLTQSGWFAVQVDPPSDFASFLQDLFLSPFASAQNYSGPLWTMPLEFYGGMGCFLFALLFGQWRFRWIAYLVSILLLGKTFYAGFVFGIFFADLYNNSPSLLSSWNKRWLLGIVAPLAIYFAGFPYYAYLAKTPISQPWYGFLPDFPCLGGSYCMVGATILFAIVLVNPHWQAFFAKPFFLYLGWLSFALYAVHFLVLRSLSAWLFVALSPVLNYHMDALVAFVAGLLVVFPLSHLVTLAIDEPSIRLADLFAKRFLLALEKAELQQSKRSVWPNRIGRIIV